MPTTEITTTLPYLAELAAMTPFAFFASALAAGTTAVIASRNRSAERRKTLAAALDRLDFPVLDEIGRISPEELIRSESATRKALDALLQAERTARSISSRKADWEVVLTHPQWAALTAAWRASVHLVAIVRWTNVPMPVKAWNGRRVHAFRGLSRVLGE